MAGRKMEFATSVKDGFMRKLATEALGGLGPAAVPALDRLLELTRDEDWDVRRAAAESLNRIMARGMRIFNCTLPILMIVRRFCS